MANPGESWKGDAGSNDWEEAYSRLDWKEQQEIDMIAEKHGLTRVEAMKKRFKNRIDIALTGQMPKDWQIYSPAELRTLQKTQQDADFLRELAELMKECDVNPATIKVGEDQELKNWKKRGEK